MLYYIILYYVILYFIILYYIMLYYIIFYYIILCYIIFYYILLYYIILCYIIFYYILLYLWVILVACQWLCKGGEWRSCKAYSWIIPLTHTAKQTLSIPRRPPLRKEIMFEGLLKHTGIKVGCCGVTCFMWEGGLEGYNDILARELLWHCEKTSRPKTAFVVTHWWLLSAAK